LIGFNKWVYFNTVTFEMHCFKKTKSATDVQFMVVVITSSLALFAVQTRCILFHSLGKSHLHVCLFPLKRLSCKKKIKVQNQRFHHVYCKKVT